MSAHTPGPWAAVETRAKTTQFDIENADGNGGPVARIPRQSPAMACATNFRGLSNARLIAAAPDLLEALRNLVIAADNLDPQSGAPVGYGVLLDAVAFADKAIAKATGSAS